MEEIQMKNLRGFRFLALVLGFSTSYLHAMEGPTDGDSLRRRSLVAQQGLTLSTSSEEAENSFSAAEAAKRQFLAALTRFTQECASNGISQEDMELMLLAMVDNEYSPPPAPLVWGTVVSETSASSLPYTGRVVRQ